VLPVRADPSGVLGPTRDQVRGPGWRRTSRGLWVPASVELSVEQRIVEAAAVLPPASGVTGWAGLKWLGGVWFDGSRPDGTCLPVDLAVGDSTIGSQPGFLVSEEHLRPYDLMSHDGLPCTTALRSVAFLMRHADTLVDAVIALDMAAYDDLVSVREASIYQHTMPAWTGIPLYRKATALADENSWSPRETWLRVAWIRDAELLAPLCNRPVFDRDGRLIGTPDLLDEEAGLVCEYDGALHLAGEQRRRDRDREAAFRRVGLEYLTVLSGDLRGQVAERLHETRDRAAYAAPSGRAWTTDLPRWWVPTFTVDQRRELTPSQRERWLRHRRAA
jgi:hypothetical protein